MFPLKDKLLEAKIVTKKDVARVERAEKKLKFEEAAMSKEEQLSEEIKDQIEDMILDDTRTLTEYDDE